MSLIENMLAGNVHKMYTGETSKPRMLVINHTTKEAWVNVTLACNTCPACQQRLALAGHRETIEIKNGALDGFLWCEVPYPVNGLTENARDVVFTPTEIEENLCGVLRNCRSENGILNFKARA